MLEVAGLAVNDDRGHRAVDGVDLTVRAGEVLGIAGVQGNGQTELVEAIMGLRPIAGRLGRARRAADLTGRSTKQILRRRRRLRPRGPQRRRPGQGLLRRREPGARPVRPAAVRQRGSALNPDAIAASARERIEQFDIRTSSAERAGRHALRRQPAEGHRGPGDVPAAASSSSPRSRPAASTSARSSSSTAGSSHERDVGTAVLLVSSELDEVLALADRIAVMYRGRIIAIVSPDTPREEIGLLMAGVDDGERAAMTSPRPASTATDEPGQPAEAPARGRRRAARRRRRASDGRAVDRRGPLPATTCGPANTVTVTVLAIVLALVIGAILIIVSDPDVLADLRLLLRPARPTRSTRAGTMVSDAYANLFKGAIVDPAAVSGWINGTGTLGAGLLPDLRDAHLRRPADLHRSRRSRWRSAAACSTSAARARRSWARSWPALVGFALPPAGRRCTCIVALLAGALGGALWGFIPGILKARTGAHEVITTIMLNYIALLLPELADHPEGHPGPGPLRRDQQGGRRVGRAAPAARRSEPAACTSASCSRCWPPGAWPGCSTARRSASSCARSAPTRDAARTAGMSVATTYVLVMVVAGALAGLGGAHDGARHGERADRRGRRQHRLRRHPGRPARPGQTVGRRAGRAALRRAAGRRQPDAVATPASRSSWSTVLQALIVLFVAAPALVKAIFRLRAARARPARRPAWRRAGDADDRDDRGRASMVAEPVRFWTRQRKVGAGPGRGRRARGRSSSARSPPTRQARFTLDRDDRRRRAVGINGTVGAILFGLIAVAAGAALLRRRGRALVRLAARRRHRRRRDVVPVLAGLAAPTGRTFMPLVDIVRGSSLLLGPAADLRRRSAACCASAPA